MICEFWYYGSLANQVTGVSHRPSRLCGDRFLGYVKGGGAWEKDNYDFTGGGISFTASETRTGWTVGVGGEYAFTDWLTGFAEYDYYDFGTKTNSFTNSVLGTELIDIKERKSVAKVGLNIKFGGPGGVMSRY